MGGAASSIMDDGDEITEHIPQSFRDGFKNRTTDTLLNVEVSLILQNKLKQMEMADEDADSTKQEMLMKFKDYVDQFQHYKKGGDDQERESAKNVRSLLEEQYKLEGPEMALVANLCPEDVEEAKHLVKSLNRMDDDRIKNMLDELKQFRDFK